MCAANVSMPRGNRSVPPLPRHEIILEPSVFVEGGGGESTIDREALLRFLPQAPFISLFLSSFPFLEAPW